MSPPWGRGQPLSPSPPAPPGPVGSPAPSESPLSPSLPEPGLASSPSGRAPLSNCSEPLVSRFIRKHVASCLLVSDTSTELSYMLPSEATKKGAFERLFQVPGRAGKVPNRQPGRVLGRWERAQPEQRRWAQPGVGTGKVGAGAARGGDGDRGGGVGLSWGRGRWEQARHAEPQPPEPGVQP